MENLKNPFVASGVAATLVMVAMYIDSKMNKREHERNSYIKIALLVGVVVGVFVHFTGGSLSMSGGSEDIDIDTLDEAF